MNNSKCFCHLNINGITYEVKDATARKETSEIKEELTKIKESNSGSNNMLECFKFPYSALNTLQEFERVSAEFLNNGIDLEEGFSVITALIKLECHESDGIAKNLNMLVEGFAKTGPRSYILNGYIYDFSSSAWIECMVNAVMSPEDTGHDFPSADILGIVYQAIRISEPALGQHNLLLMRM